MDVTDTTINDDAVVDTPTDAVETPVVETPTEDNSLDAVISRNFDKLAKDEATEATEAVVEPKVEAKPVAATDGKVVDPISGRTLEPIKAPVLPVSLRDKWGTLPREFQQYWADRERDMAVKIQETTDDRKLAKEFKDIASPYEAMLRQHNTTATAHVSDLLKASYTLNTGTPQQRAEVFYGLLAQFQPDAATLQALIQRKPIPMAQQQAAKPVNVQEEVDKALKTREETRAVNEGKAAADAFKADPANEFFDDVRDTMSKAIDAGFVQGSTWPELLKKAYDFAVQQHPEIKKVLADRATAATPAAKPKPVASVKPSLGPGNRNASPKKKMSPQEAVEWAWKQNGGE
jgi:hypothetical protein